MGIAVKKVVVAGALVLLAVLGARAESGVPRYDVDGACAAYVDTGLSPVYNGGATRNEAISSCVDWEQIVFKAVKEKWQTATPATRDACAAQVKEKIGWWNKANEAWGIRLARRLPRLRPGTQRAQEVQV
jgi:hypothetical protein